ncbi:hypothetical protein MRX96_025440 [Rhipicephalus microplus]
MFDQVIAPASDQMERSGDVSRHAPCPIRVCDAGSLSRTKPSWSISSASLFPLGESAPYPHCVCGALKSPQIKRGLEAAFAIASRKRVPKLVARDYKRYKLTAVQLSCVPSKAASEDAHLLHVGQEQSAVNAGGGGRRQFTPSFNTTEQ